MLKRIVLTVVIVFLMPVFAYSYDTIDFLHEIGSYGKEPGMFRGPKAVAVDERGGIYVADTRNDRIQVFGPAGDFLMQWGKSGSGRGEFDDPSGIAIGGDRVYVADTGNHRIEIFDTQGNFMDSFGSKGKGPKEFRKPKGLAFRNGLLYVADYGNDRVQVFTADGVFLYEISQEKDRNLILEEPGAVAVDPPGNIYVIDGEGTVRVVGSLGRASKLNMLKGDAITTGPNGVYIVYRNTVYQYDFGLTEFFLSGSSKKLIMTGVPGGAKSAFREISAVGADGMGNLYVLDSDKSALRVFRSEYEPADVRAPYVPSSVAYVKDIPAPKDLFVGQAGEGVFAFDPSGEKIVPVSGDAGGGLWLVNGRKRSVQLYSPEGRLVLTVGGKRDGTLSEPADIRLNRNTVYVADEGSANVLLFDESGKFISSFGEGGRGGGGLSKPAAIAFDEKDNLYVVDEGLNKVVKTDSAGNFIREFGSEGDGDGQFRKPRGICVIGGEIYVLDSGNNRIEVFDADGHFLRKFGSEGKGKGEFSEPVSLHSDGKYNLYVFDPENRRIEVLKLLLTPSQPETLKAEGMIREVKITWSPNPEPHIAAYRIFRKRKEEEDFREIGQIRRTFSVAKYSYFDKDLESNTTYYYAVAAVSKTGNASLMSKTVKATTKRLVPSAPKLIKAEPGQRDMSITWAPSPESYTDHYLIMRNRDKWQTFREIGTTKEPSFQDSGLVPNSLYKYMVVAVGTEGDRSEPLMVEAMTAKLPPIEIAGMETSAVFSNNYKYYESHPIGKIMLKNNTDNPIENVKISLMVQGYMDYPTEGVIGKIEPGKTLEAPLKAVFSNALLGLSENSDLQAAVTVSYFGDGESRTLSVSRPFHVFEKHALVWDSAEKAAIYITPKDPLLMDISSKATRDSGKPVFNRNLLRARNVFDALGVMGLAYAEDPNNPYQVVSQNVSLVDYVMYPRETLKRKAGDCVDLAVLYSSLLEGLGMHTAFVTYPGHILLLFDTALDEGSQDQLGFPAEDYVIYKGTVWAPVETTLVGKSFAAAWAKGSDEFHEWEKKGLKITDLRDAWQDFKPATLQYDDWRPETPDAARIESAFPDEIAGLRAKRHRYLSSLLLREPVSGYSLLQLGILYGENGMYQEALEVFAKYAAMNGEDATVMNNVGNVYLLGGDLRNAEKAYLKALSHDPGDAGILVNLSRLYYRLGKKAKAGKFLDEAVKRDPEVADKYFHLSSKLRR